MSSWLSSILCIVLWKRYGASHLNCLLAIFDPNLIIQKKLKVLYRFGYFFQTGFLVEPIFPACGSAAENGSPTTFKVVDARIDARPGNSKLGLPVSSFDTSFDNDKPASSHPVSLHIFGTSAETSRKVKGLGIGYFLPEARDRYTIACQ